MDGILNVLKPAGPTSFDVVSRLKRWSGERKAGHAGTLDPAASGTFPVCLGQATKIIPYLLEFPKTYRAVIELGLSTDTYDAVGQVIRRGDPSGVTAEILAQALDSFRGRIWQKPPPYSALKHQGRRLYELARAGIAVETPPRQVEVFRLELERWEPPHLTIVVECGRGFYLRSIAYDLGEALSCGGHLKELIRVQYGVFSLAQATPLPQLEEAFRSEQWQPFLHPIDSPLEAWPKLSLTAAQVALVRQGQPLSLPYPGRLGERGRAYSPQGQFLAVLRFKGQRWHPERVFL